MKAENSKAHLSLTCQDGWLDLECRLPLRPLGRALALVILAATTIWGGPEMLHFAQMLLGQR
jgi:hypothetical protein